MELYRYVKEVVNKETGEIKRYTNFYLEVVLNGNKINVPIQPVNFGEKSNRSNYHILRLASKEVINNDRNNS